MIPIIFLMLAFDVTGVLFVLFLVAIVVQLLRWCVLTRWLTQLLEDTLRFSTRFSLERGYDIVRGVVRGAYEIIVRVTAELWRYRLGKLLLIVLTGILIVKYIF